MRLTNPQRLIHKRNIVALKHNITKSVAKTPNFIKNVKYKTKEIMFDNFFHLQNCYLRLMKLDEVKSYQKKVEAVQVQLQSAQEKKREIGHQLYQVRDKLSEMQREISNVDRHQEAKRLVGLVKKETEILRLESTISRTFQECEKLEREIFTAYCNAVLASHEKQKYQSEYAKLFVYVSSVLTVIICIVNYYKENNNKIVRENDSQKIKEILETMKKNNDYSRMSSINSSMKTVVAGVTSAPGYIYSKLPSYDAVTSAPRKFYNCSADFFKRPNIYSKLPSYDAVISAPNKIYNYCADFFKRK